LLVAARSHNRPDRVPSVLASFLRLSLVTAFGLPLAVLTNIVLARLLSTIEYGTYGLVIATASVLAIPIASGIPLLLTREVSGYAADKAWAHYAGLMNSVYGWTGAYTIFLLVAFVAYENLSGHASIRGLTPALALVALLLVPLMSVSNITAGALRGFGYPSLAAIPQQLIQPLLLVIGLAMLGVAFKLTIESALLWNVFAAVAAALLLLILLRRNRPAHFVKLRANYADHGRWLRCLLPFMTIGAVGTLTTNIAILILGFLGNEEAVAHLRVAERGAQLAMFPLVVLETVIGPRIVQYWKAGDLSGLKLLARSSTRLTFLATLTIAVPLIAWGRPIIGFVFGANYADTVYVPMVILTIAQTVFVGMGSAGAILAMTGNERDVLRAQLVGLISLACTAAALIPGHAATGAAIGAAAGLVIMKSFQAAMVWRKMSFWPGIA
jgi:O-antigen/teichoic acid export membrane protein